MTVHFDIPDQTGKRFIVTGANSGLGLAVTERLARAGAQVVLAVRDPQRGRQAMERLLGAHPMARLSVEGLDLANLQSIADLADRLKAIGQPIDVLINNAGIMAPPRRHTTPDGFELQFGTNHLGHFALSAHLLPLLQMAPAARVVTLSSGVNHIGSIDFGDLQWERRRYSPYLAYAQSKLANLSFAVELNRRSLARGWGILSLGAHPGVTRTNLQTSGPNLGTNAEGPGLPLWLSQQIPGIWQDVEQGCLPTLYAAVSPRAVGGGYYGPDGWGELTGGPASARIPASARNAYIARELWNASERLTHVTFRSGA